MVTAVEGRGASSLHHAAEQRDERFLMKLIDTLFKHGTIYHRTEEGEIVPCLSVISIRLMEDERGR